MWLSHLDSSVHKKIGLTKAKEMTIIILHTNDTIFFKYKKKNVKSFRMKTLNWGDFKV